MDQESTASEPLNQGFDPHHYWATPDSRVVIKDGPSHVCMKRIKQIGRYIHCFDGNHGMRIPAGMRLQGLDENGQPITSRNRKVATSFRLIPIVPIPSTAVKRQLPPKK